jgi:molecular chaperone DnaK
MVEMKNEGESLIYNTEKQLKENDGKLSQEIKDRIKADISSVHESINSGNHQNLKDNLEKLRNSAMEMGRTIYQNASQSQSEQPKQEEPKTEEPKKDEEKKQ